MSSNRSRSHSRSRSRNSTSDTSSSISSSKSEEVSQDILEKSRKSKHSEKKEKYDKKDKQDADDQRDDIVIVFDWNSYDSFCILILMFFGIFSRFWIIQYPRSFVGKEELQIQYINSYLNGSFFMDSEPPLSSLILAFTAHSLGYRQTIKPPYHNSNYTFQSMEYMSLRVPSALLSSFVVPISFVIVRLLGGSTFASLGAGFFTLFDFLLIGTARICASDGFVQFSVALSVFFSALLRHFHPSSTSWSICIILQSFFAGIALSSNWNAINVVIFIIIFNYLTYHTFRPIPVNIIITALIFYFSFFAHAIFTPFESINDYLLSDGYRKDLISHGSPLHIKHHKIPFRAIELIFLCHKLHRKCSSFVPIIKWVFMACPWKVLWQQGGRSVAVFGNPPVWYGIGLATIFEITKIILSKRIRENTAIIFCGYISCLLSFLFKTSENGLCDYQIAVMFGIWGLALSLDTELPPSFAGFTLSSMVVAAGFIFLLWSPLVYGYESFDMRFLPHFAESVET